MRAGLAVLRRELAPRPGRLGNALRVVGAVLVLVTIFEWFRIPEAPVACFIALFLSQDNEAASVLTAAIVGVAGVAGILLAILLFMATLGEPALRIGCIAVVTFATMFLSRAMTLGAPVFVAGFLAAFGLTYGDAVASFGLAPGSVANTAEFSVPEFVFLPPEESLLHLLLWLVLAVALPALVVAGANLLTGRDPVVLLRAGLAERLGTAARACGGDAGSVARLEAFAREGEAALARLAEMAGKIHRPTPRSRSDAALVEPVVRLSVLVLVWSRADTAGGGAAIGAAGRFAASVGAAVLDGGSVPPVVPDVPEVGDALLQPLAAELAETLGRVGTAFGLRAQPLPRTAKEAAKAGLLKADAWRNPDYPRFALKVTLGALLCYVAYTGANWPQIHTAMVTCFFVALGTAGETLHKVTLRIVGCLIGAGLGIGTILWLMPAMTDLGDLLAAVGVVTLLAAWVSNGSARISYAGVQIALAYFLTVLQGFGPTLDMQTGRDRAVGILFGSLVASAVFMTVWPVRIGAVVRGRLAGGLEALAAAVAAVGTRADLRPFRRAVDEVSALLADAPYEKGFAGRRRLAGAPPDRMSMAALQALAVPFAVVLRLGEAGGSEAVRVYHAALASWLRGVAHCLRDGTGHPGVRPAPPVLGREGAGASQAAWYGRLDRELGTVVERLLPEGSVAAAG